MLCNQNNVSWVCIHSLTATNHPSLCLLLVLARDGGVPSLSGTATIICTIEDENDHSPELIVLSHDIEVLENQDPGVVYTALAFDMDAGNNGAVTYRIAGEYRKARVLSGYLPSRWSGHSSVLVSVVFAYKIHT